MMTLRALIFDFDGLIMDTETSSLAAVQEAYRRHGHELPSDHVAPVRGHHRRSL